MHWRRHWLFQVGAIDEGVSRHLPGEEVFKSDPHCITFTSNADRLKDARVVQLCIDIGRVKVPCLAPHVWLDAADEMGGSSLHLPHHLKEGIL